MHDEKYGASGLEQSEPAAKFEMGGGSAHLDALSAGRDNEFVGIHSSNLAHTADVNSAMPGWDERPGLKLPGIDQPTSASPEPLWDMSPVASSSIQKRNNVSISRIFDDNNGRTAWVFLAALMITLGIGFAGGLASHQYLNPEAPLKALPQQVNSSSHVRVSGKSVAKTDMLPRTTTASAGSKAPDTLEVSAPAVSQPSRALPAFPGASQFNVAPPNAAKSTEPAHSLFRPEIPGREAMVKPVPETRPTTIEGWTVREVRGEAIILQGPDGVRKVMRGDTVPGVGRIDSVVRWGSRWIVATTSGLIATP